MARSRAFFHLGSGLTVITRYSVLRKYIVKCLMLHHSIEATQEEEEEQAEHEVEAQAPWVFLVSQPSRTIRIVRPAWRPVLKFSRGSRGPRPNPNPRPIRPTCPHHTKCVET